MKKTILILFLIFTSSTAFCQLTQTTNPYQCICKGHPMYGVNILYHYTVDNTYYLVVESDNQYEDQTANICLGTKDEAISLLNDLLSTIKTSNKNTYNINGYDMTGSGYLMHTGKIEYTAGHYKIYPLYLKMFIKKLNNI